ncbi:organic anion transporter 3 [Octopus bimaculoides]|uniref:Major facilitator superfamily (MFS) profile domain-containing protein n=1 Tax=Octopus bimaculoides TaxID=37653 RepID=A0A0L8HKF7_OCTBM|nr:organic anion transporter 3 [Octopus bimaculoides]|eukprot:XP_014771611.1 PREDICTED: solute carrier family 22 member 8-like isoform X1 [Octopus bimaculoides]
MSPDSSVNVDKIIRSLNQTGRFNIIQYLIVSLNSLAIASNVLAIVFIGIYPDYQCRPYDNSSIWPKEIENYTKYDDADRKHWIEYGECAVDVVSVENDTKSKVLSLPCTNGYIYNDSKDNSFVSEWDLVCEKSALGPFTQTMQTIGMTLGAMLVPTFADRYGRKPVIIVCQLLLGASSFGVRFSPNLQIFTGLKVFVGFFQQGIAVPSQNIAIELFSTEHRAVIAMLYGFNWVTGCMFLVLQAYLFSSYGWRATALSIACNSVVVILNILFMEESLRWLFAKGYLDKAESLIKRTAKTNNLDFDTIWNTHVAAATELIPISEKEAPPEEIALHSEAPISAIHQDHESNSFINSNTTAPEYGAEFHAERKLSVMPEDTRVWVLFTNPTLCLIMCINLYCWFMAALSYYGLYLTSGSLEGSHYLNFFINSFCEMMAMSTLWKGFEWFGRKKTLVFHFSIGSLSLIATTVLNIVLSKNSSLRVLISVATFLGMFGISGAFADLWSYLPELIPTDHRNAALGLASSAARIGSALSPFSAFLVEIIPWGPAVIFSAGCFIANLLILFLPESRGRQLPQTIADVEAWLKKDEKKKSKNAEEIKPLNKE